MAEKKLYLNELEVAIDACNQAEGVIRKYFFDTFTVETKADNSPVTVADVEAEKTIRNVLLDAFPDYGFYGEETGQESMQAEFRWLVDPIDGTKSFVRHSPFFSTQIALQKGDELVVGVSNAPCYQPDAAQSQSGEQLTAALGQPVFMNGREVGTSQVKQIENAYLSSGNLKSLAGDAAAWQRYGDVVGRAARVRGYGDFCHYHQLASGQADVVIESDVNILDIAALSLAVVQAGGVFTDLEGNSIGLETTSVLAAATPELHQQVLEILSGG